MNAIDVHCDGCKANCMYVDTLPHIALVMLKRSGWTFQDHKHYCPKCSKKRAKAKP